MIKNGWHKVYHYDVLIEDGTVKHATVNGTSTLYPYRISRWGGMNRIENISINALRSGLYRGTIYLR